MTTDADNELNIWNSGRLYPHLSNDFYGTGHGHISNPYLNYLHFLFVYWEVCYVSSCQTVFK